VTDQDWEPGERGRAFALAVLLLGAILYPVRQNWRPCKKDGFPLSYYPMFSHRRRQHTNIHYAVAVHADGSRQYVASEVLGIGGLNQVRRQLNRVVKRGEVAEFAQRLAERVAADPASAEVVRVEIVRGEFDLDVCLLNRRLEGTETILGAADVPSPVAAELPTSGVGT
jgi:hypothetical protein